MYYPVCRRYFYLGPGSKLKRGFWENPESDRFWTGKPQTLLRPEIGDMTAPRAISKQNAIQNQKKTRSGPRRKPEPEPAQPDRKKPGILEIPARQPADSDENTPKSEKNPRFDQNWPKLEKNPRFDQNWPKLEKKPRSDQNWPKSEKNPKSDQNMSKSGNRRQISRICEEK